MSPTNDLATLVERIESSSELDRVVEPLQQLVARIPEPARSVLRGDWLGHALHPMLTDLPIGFWTSSWVLDVTAPRRAARASTGFVGLGVAATVPAMAAGLVDWAELPREKQRAGVVHLGLNVLATAAYLRSYTARTGGARRRGIAFGMIGAGLATASGYLGGHLAFTSGAKGGAPDDHPAGAEDRAGTADRSLTDGAQVREAVGHLGGDGLDGQRTEPVVGA